LGQLAAEGLQPFTAAGIEAHGGADRLEPSVSLSACRCPAILAMPGNPEVSRIAERAPHGGPTSGSLGRATGPEAFARQGLAAGVAQLALPLG
jgi:hypothetical protein